MCGREYQDFRHYACLEGIPHEDDPDYDWKFQIYRAGMNAVREKTRVPSSPDSSESGVDEVEDNLEEVIGGSSSKLAKICRVFCPMYNV